MALKNVQIADALGITRQALDQYRDRVEQYTGKQVGRMVGRTRLYDVEHLRILASYEGIHQDKLQNLLAELEPPKNNLPVDTAEPGKIVKAEVVGLVDWDSFLPDDTVEEEQQDIIDAIIETEETNREGFDNVFDRMAVKYGKQQAQRVFMLRKQAFLNELTRLEKEDLQRGKERLSGEESPPSV